jgi:hypothetical protein
VWQNWWEGLRWSRRCEDLDMTVFGVGEERLDEVMVENSALGYGGVIGGRVWEREWA